MLTFAQEISKIDHTDPVFGLWPEFISRPVHARL